MIESDNRNLAGYGPPGGAPGGYQPGGYGPGGGAMGGAPPPYGPPGGIPVQHAPAPNAGTPMAAHKREAAGLMRGLFDFGFSTFITGKVVKFLYILYILCVGLGFLLGEGSALMALAASAAPERPMGFSGAPGLGGGMGGLGGGLGAVGALFGIVQMLVTPVVCVIALIYGRVACECVIVFFRVADHVGEIDRKTRG